MPDDNTEPIESRLREIVADQLGVGSDDIAVDSDFSTDLGADALDLIELVMAFEEEFDREISDEEAESMRTIKDVIEFLGQRVQ